MLTVLTFLWRDPKYRWNDRFLYSADHVNRLAASVRRNLDLDHEFACVTDTPEGINKSVRIIPLWNDYREMGGCYLRLKLFSLEMRKAIGDRFVQIDVDSVVTGNLTKLFNRPDEFVAWKNINWPRTFYCGSMFMMTAGARSQVWSTFDKARSPELTKAKGICGTDQAWISHVLGDREAKWSEKDGVLSYLRDIKQRNGDRLPDNARIVFFNGPYDPSMANIRSKPWVTKHWRH